MTKEVLQEKVTDRQGILEMLQDDLFSFTGNVEEAARCRVVLKRLKTALL